MVGRAAGRRGASRLGLGAAGLCGRPGIAPEHRPLLFKRFARPDAARSREQGGAGLGLALSAGVVAAHGGRIELLSDGAPGAAFRFFIPD